VAAALAAVAAVVVVAVLNRPGGTAGTAGQRRTAAHGARATTHGSAAPRDSRPGVPGWLAALEARVKGQPGHLAPGSDPAVLPGPVLIADRNNNRLLLVDPKGRVLWTFPGTGPQSAGQALPAPDDAFFGPHGRHIIATQESRFTLSVISVPGSTITWRYGHPGVPGPAPGYLDNPDDAMLLPDGNVMTADIKNCRLLELSRTSTVPLHVYGITDPYCYHAPPQRFGSPNGMFPMTNGDWLVTEINGDWADEMTPTGKIVWSVHPPGITYPSDTNEVSPGVFLTASYTRPGVIEEFTRTGKLLWRYQPTGANALNEPSLALPLPNGDILANADWSDRVVVIDPKTSKIVWQYGHTGVPGSKPGYLYKPDGVDLAPPYSLLITHAATMGIPPYGRSGHGG
jgi:outer membrane protein assembly factor BamB